MSKVNTRVTINANIKQNGNQEITGQILNSVLNTMVDDYAEQEKLTELDGDIKGIMGGDIPLTLSYDSNVLPNPDGTFFTETSSLKKWWSSGYVEIPKGATSVKFGAIQFNTTTITPIAFYDKDKVFISCYPFQEGSTVFRFIEGEMYIPKDAVYFMQSKYIATSSEGNHPERYGDNYSIFTVLPKYDFDKMEQSANKIGDEPVLLGVSDFTSNVIYKADGSTKTYGDPWRSTDFVPCKGGQTLDYKGYIFYQGSDDVAVVSFFDDGRTFIGCVASSSFSKTQGNVDGRLTIQDGCSFVRVVSLSTRADSLLALSATGLIAASDDVSVLNKNNLKGIKVCCIGDSLTEGVDVGSHVIAESYPYFMSKYLNCSIVNYGKRGETSKSWWNKFSSTNPFDSSMDVVLIMFGTNGGLTTNTLATDVEPYDDWHNYADTSVGDYCKLIESIMEQTENKAQIILMTPPYSSYTPQQTQTVINTEPVVRAIAKRYNLPVIDVLNECGMGKFNAAIFRPHDGCHFNAKGYHKLGTFIGSRLKSMFSTFDFTDVYDDETPIS